MKFLADENIPELTLDLLRKQEIDIISISQLEPESRTGMCYG